MGVGRETFCEHVGNTHAETQILCRSFTRYHLTRETKYISFRQTDSIHPKPTTF